MNISGSTTISYKVTKATAANTPILITPDLLLKKDLLSGGQNFFHIGATPYLINTVHCH
jgi:hypothetical protein